MCACVVCRRLELLNTAVITPLSLWPDVTTSNCVVGHVTQPERDLTVLSACLDACAARAGCSSKAVTEDFTAAAAQCAAVATNSSLCTLLDSLTDPHSEALKVLLSATCATQHAP